MMDMVERVARALLAESERAHPGSATPAIEPPWLLFEKQARAAIEAMREPSDEMVLAGAHFYRDNWRKTHAREDTDAEAIWQAMIDAALTPAHAPIG